MAKTSRKSGLIRAVLAVGVISSFAAPAIAAESGYGGVIRINAEGKRLCDAYKANGVAYWSGKVRGRFEDGFGGSIDRFTVRTCFKNPTECETFLRRIHHRVFPIEQIFFSRCKAES